MNKLFVDIKGKKFGYFTVLEFIGKNHSVWRCQCDCGNIRLVRRLSLEIGETVSCGCKRRKHGYYKTRTYRIWSAMKARCCNPNTEFYQDYGGRGISVCDSWISSFSEFLKDMGEPSPGMTIERRNNDGNYELSNCYWASRQKQARNRRSNRIIEYNGERKSLTEWAETVGISESTLRRRIDVSGWTLHQAFTLPLQRVKRRMA